MSARRGLAALAALATAVLFAVASAGCNYVVPPIEFGTPTPYILDSGWAGIVNNVTENGGALHVDLSIVNNTGQWSAMDVGGSKASVSEANGSSRDCTTVFVGTSVFVNNGGWYLPPGFVMKGYTGGSVSEPVTQPLYVECSGVKKGSGQTLSISYRYISGEFNYYLASRYMSKTMKLELDKVETDTVYPVAQKDAGLPINKAGDAIVGINDCTLTLASAIRTETGLEFSWLSTNPTKDRVYLHIGVPPVIGSDGILYGFYRSPHRPDPPITPAGGQADWKTEQAVPKEVTGLYLLLPLETRQAKLFVDHVVDITNL